MFTSVILPPYLRKSGAVEELVPWLCFKGILRGEFPEAVQDKVYVLAVNTGIIDAKWTCNLHSHLTTEPVATRCLFDGVDVPMEAASTLRDTIPACGRRVYEIQVTPATP